MSLYHLLRKAGNGFGFRHTTGVNARLQTWSLKQEKVLVNHVTVEQEAYSFSVGSSH
jgi:phage-related protein